MEQAAADGSARFFLAHVFFLVVFVALVWALVMVVLHHRQPAPLLLAAVPLALIFVTAFLAPRLPAAHRAVNIVYDGLLIYNAYYFWASNPRALRWLYLAAVIGTALDFAMHFVINIA
ncbi:MAG: hypothetical protein AB1515_10570 [Nitrospirota bacterium]